MGLRGDILLSVNSSPRLFRLRWRKTPALRRTATFWALQHLTPAPSLLSCYFGPSASLLPASRLTVLPASAKELVQLAQEGPPLSLPLAEPVPALVASAAHTAAPAPSALADRPCTWHLLPRPHSVCSSCLEGTLGSRRAGHGSSVLWAKELPPNSFKGTLQSK